MDAATQRRLVTALAGHLGRQAGGAVEIVETHISWVILAGEHAYKLKKPLNLGFLDFSSLAKRRLACEEEIRLNRRTAPDIYLDVVAIGGSAGAPRLDATPAIEYAVRMRRFARDDGLDFLLARNALGMDDIGQVATMIAAFHDGAARATDGGHGTPGRILEDALANFSQMPALAFDNENRERLRRLHDWTLAEHARHAPLMEARMRAGQVRECHGDLHLANMVRHGGRIVAFDCIEFNPEMRWIDVANDLAFTLMDLRHRGHAEFARLLLDVYLSQRGDWAGVPLLPFYLCYRAMVRAKVAAIRAHASIDKKRQHDEALQDCMAHLWLAESFTQPGKPRLVITSGLSGSGKSHWSGLLLRARDWLRLRSDVERKRLAGLAPMQASGAALNQGLYAPAATAGVYASLATVAGTLLGAGFAVIVDATFLKRAQRKPFRELALRLGVPFTILALTASSTELRGRLETRLARGNDASEANHAILASQVATVEPFDSDEATCVLALDTQSPPDLAKLLEQIEAPPSASPPNGRSATIA